MGSYDEAETCELVGCYLLSQLKQIPGIEVGLYRDYGLAILNHTPREMEKAKKQICQIFANNNLKITADVNTGKFKPYSKPSTTPLYVHSQSNHSPNILRNIPEAINRQLSSISSDHEVFNDAGAPCQEALRKSGYTFKLEFKPPAQQPPSQKHKRQRNVIWFNPPYNKSVKTNIGRAFISLIERSFPAGHKLRKIFNRNTIKLSYSCMPNVKQIIDGHNKAILKIAETAQRQKDEGKTRSCRKKEDCLVNAW